MAPGQLMASARPPVVKSVLEAIAISPRVRFVTLTTRYSYDSIRMSAEIGECMHRVNRRHYGMSYARRGMRISSYAVQELNQNQGRHTHMLVGFEDSAAWKAAPCPVGFEELIVNTWCNLGPGRRRDAQDVRPVHDFTGAVSYIHKDIRQRGNLDQLDVLNLRIAPFR